MIVEKANRTLLIKKHVGHAGFNEMKLFPLVKNIHNFSECLYYLYFSLLIILPFSDVVIEEKLYLFHSGALQHSVLGFPIYTSPLCLHLCLKALNS